MHSCICDYYSNDRIGVNDMAKKQTEFIGGNIDKDLADRLAAESCKYKISKTRAMELAIIAWVEKVGSQPALTIAPTRDA